MTLDSSETMAPTGKAVLASTVPRRTFAIALIVFTSAVAVAAETELPERFQFLATYRLFERIKAAPGFNIAKPATYGYFFTSQHPERLSAVRLVLDREGYTFVESHVDRADTHWLQVARSEVHTADSMVERSRWLLSVIRQHEGVVYDGWDITRNER